MKKAELDSVTVTREGHLEVRIAKCVNVDGEEIFLGWHRTVVEVGGDVDAHMATVNAHLNTMGVNALPEESMAELKSYASIAATPQRLQAQVEKQRNLRGE